MIYQLPDGRCVRRKDKSTMPASVDQIQFERQEIKSREYDSQFVDGALVTHLDLKLLQGIADEYIKGLSIERYLQQIGLAEYGLNGLRLKRAALLLCATDIDRWHPRHESRNSLIARVLRENKLMRELGEGMKRIFNLMQKQELAKPELYSNGLWFRVTLKKKSQNF